MKKSLDERVRICNAGCQGFYSMEDRLLNLKVSDMLKHLEKQDKDITNRIQKDERENEALGDVIEQMMEPFVNGYMPQEKVPYLIYLLLIEPFAMWIKETGYVPDDEFLTRTGIIGLPIETSGDIPYGENLFGDDCYDYDDCDCIV